ncbi:hypothetical protein EON83_29285 [bacterium]|nr:MAG: hypothetical protein EON83_29285 [bacterium]
MKALNKRRPVAREDYAERPSPTMFENSRIGRPKCGARHFTLEIGQKPQNHQSSRHRLILNTMEFEDLVAATKNQMAAREQDLPWHQAEASTDDRSCHQIEEDRSTTSERAHVALKYP